VSNIAERYQTSCQNNEPYLGHGSIVGCFVVFDWNEGSHASHCVHTTLQEKTGKHNKGLNGHTLI
jgi:hypothetical protein